MTTFDRREETFESRFAHDQEMTFKARARRNDQLGRWAAEQLGKQGTATEDYAQGLIAIGIEGGGDDDIVRKLQHDFGIAGVTQSEHQIRRRMDEMLVASLQALRSA